MKKAVKRVLLIAGLILILPVTGLLGFRIPIMTMKPAETGPVSDSDIFAVKNDINSVFLIQTSGGYIMFDSGSNLKMLELSLEKAQIDPNDIKWIFLTHSDYDHVAGLPLFANAEILMSEDEVQMVNGTTKRNLFGRNKLPAATDGTKITLLQNNQELMPGGITVKCIKAPGHTPGSMVYLTEGRYLFTGDAFKIKNDSPGIHPFTMNRKLAQKTINQLKETIDSSSIVLTAHYNYIIGNRAF